MPPLLQSYRGGNYRDTGGPGHLIALLAREGEKIGQLLERLDIALGKVMADDSVIDEVLPEIKRRRSR